MAVHSAGPYTLTIANGGTDSGALSASSSVSAGILKLLVGSLISVTVFAPATVTGTITIQVKPNPAAADWTTLQSAGADVTIAAGKAVTLSSIPFGDMRIHSSGAEGAERVFTLLFQITHA
jgi:hypothetical protein